MIGIGIGINKLGGRRGPNLLVNSGAPGLTDWVDTNEDGTADDWVQSFGTGTPAIVTENGFTGNAQRINHENGTTTQFKQLTGINAVNGATYGFSMKYRTNLDEGWRIYMRGTTGLIDLDLAANAGDAIFYSNSCVSPDANQIVLNFYCHTDKANCYLEVDEVVLYKR